MGSSAEESPFKGRSETGNSGSCSKCLMLRVALLALTFTCASILLPFEVVFAGDLTNKVRDILRTRISPSLGSQKIACRMELLCGSQVLPRFYSNRNFLPAWIANDEPGRLAANLVRAIQDAPQEGLRPEDYHIRSIEELIAEIRYRMVMQKPVEAEKLADLDLLLSDAFLLYGSHLSTGRVNPETIRSRWNIKGRDLDLVQVLQCALDEGRIGTAIEKLRPPHSGYRTLKVALLRYRKLSEMGGWPVVPGGANLKKGNRGERVAVLRSRLADDLGLATPLSEENPDFFDEALQQAVERFQKRHGLKMDGIVGAATIAALNVAVEDRVHQIQLNLERWRWLPHDLGERHLLVNTANFELAIVENDRVVSTMRVIVGKTYRSTPVFTGRVTYMVLNPYWHIPQKIAREDILPNIKEDPQYPARHKIRVFESWQEEAREVDPGSVNWSEVTTENFSFKLVQDPGPLNALGRIKFMFPNKFSVYLHDTPQRSLFDQARRSFSSGCIRIESPLELADYLMGDVQEWSHDKMLEAIQRGVTQVIRIPNPIDIHLLYWTAWVDQEGTLHFREDIYGRDKALAEALAEKPPAP